MLVGFGLVASFALADPLKQNLLAGYARPWSLHHPLGTDQLGRDIFAWVGAGILTSLKVSISVVLISAVVGSLIGLSAGYAGGALDAVLMRSSTSSSRFRPSCCSSRPRRSCRAACST